MNKKIKAVLFDVDGSLIDSQAALYYLFKDALKKFEENNKTKEEILRPVGSSSRAWLKRLVPRLEKEKLEKMRRWTVMQYAEYYMRKHAKPIRYSNEVLKELKKNNIKLGIVTNQTRKQVNMAFKIFRFNKFNVIASVDKVKRPKPQPDLLKYALKKLKLKKDEVIYIGDTRADIKAGKAAGIETYLLEHRYNKHIRAKKIKTLKEVLGLVLCEK